MAAILGCFLSEKLNRRTAILSQKLLTMKYEMDEPRTLESNKKSLCTVGRAFCPQTPAVYWDKRKAKIFF